MIDFKIIYEEDDLLVVDKPAGIIVFQETITKRQDAKITALIDLLIEKYPKLGEVGSPPRYGAVHRLDKETSGVLLVAKNEKALIFLQKQFFAHTFSSIGKSWDGSAHSAEMGGKNVKPLEKTIEKKYIALVCGIVKEDNSVIHTLLGRSPSDPRKQKAYPTEFLISNTQFPMNVKREAITEYKVLQRFEKYTLLEVRIKTGRRHQIRCHLAYVHHPIAGDKLYGFKDSPIPEGLKRQFLHAVYLKIKLPDGKIKEFQSDLPDDLQKILNNLETTD